MAYLTIQGPEGESLVQLTKEETFLGRSESVDIRVDAHWVSSRHARLKLDEEGWLIEDLGSSNGTFLNYERIESARLKDNDLVFLGRTKMVFRSSTASLEESAVELDILDSRSGILTRAPEPWSIKPPEPARAPSEEEIKELAERSPTMIPGLEEAEAAAAEAAGQTASGAATALAEAGALQTKILELSGKLTSLELELEREKRRSRRELEKRDEELQSWKTKYYGAVQELESVRAADSEDGSQGEAASS